jgi:phosphate transport system protein
MGFKSFYDLLTKGTLLEEAFDESEHIHDLTSQMFSQSITALLEHDKKLTKEIVTTDKEVNREFINIRRKLFEYLSISAAPNVSACLILSNVAIDYERIGDYCKNIAQLVEWYPVEFRDGQYKEKILAIRKNIETMFTHTKSALINEDEELAQETIALHGKVKEIHKEIVDALNNDSEISVREAIVIAKAGGYLRRVSAHLGNICTGVLRPFPRMGFLKKIGREIETEDAFSRPNLD